jgi:hypothetical protein
MGYEAVQGTVIGRRGARRASDLTLVPKTSATLEKPDLAGRVPSAHSLIAAKRIFFICAELEASKIAISFVFPSR